MGENEPDVKESLAELTRVLQEVKCSATNLTGRLEEIAKKESVEPAVGDNTVDASAGNGSNVGDANGGNVNSVENTSSEGPIVVASRRASGSNPGVQPTSEPVAV